MQHYTFTLAELNAVHLAVATNGGHRPHLENIWLFTADGKQGAIGTDGRVLGVIYEGEIGECINPLATRSLTSKDIATLNAYAKINKIKNPVIIIREDAVQVIDGAHITKEAAKACIDEIMPHVQLDKTDSGLLNSFNAINWPQVIPKPKDEATLNQTATLNLNCITLISKIGKALGTNKADITLREDSPCVFTFPESPSFYGIVMPMRK